MLYTGKFLITVVISTLIMALLTGCATPKFEQSDKQYVSGQVARERVQTETGWQLLWGERSASIEQMQYGVDKKTMGVTGGALGGALVGAASGNVAAGAVVGTIAGGIGEAIGSKKTTASTTASDDTTSKSL